MLKNCCLFHLLIEKSFLMRKFSAALETQQGEYNCLSHSCQGWSRVNMSEFSIS